MDIVALLGQNLREQRLARGLTQEELAGDAGIKRSYLSELERGLRNPTVRALGRLAEALDIDPAVLLFRKADAANLRELSDNRP
jgi:transcriptional regulator with XRE-family HTH domain